MWLHKWGNNICFIDHKNFMHKIGLKHLHRTKQGESTWGVTFCRSVTHVPVSLRFLGFGLSTSDLSLNRHRRSIPMFSFWKISNKNSFKYGSRENGESHKNINNNQAWLCQNQLIRQRTPWWQQKHLNFRLKCLLKIMIIAFYLFLSFPGIQLLVKEQQYSCCKQFKI